MRPDGSRQRTLTPPTVIAVSMRMIGCSRRPEVMRLRADFAGNEWQW